MVYPLLPLIAETLFSLSALGELKYIHSDKVFIIAIITGFCYIDLLDIAPS